MTHQPDALPACPSCGHTNIGIIESCVAEGFFAVCNLCYSAGPYVSKEKAIAAFTNPAHALAASRAEVERLREALEEIIKAWDHKTGDYYVDNYLSDVEIDAARAALAAQGGGT